MQNMLHLWHWQPHKFQRGSCSDSFCREVCSSACNEFCLFFSPFCQRRQKPKSGYSEFLYIYPLPLKLMGEVWVTDCLVREKLGVLSIMLLTEVCYFRFMVRKGRWCSQASSYKNAIQLLCLDPGRMIWTQEAGYVVKENIRFCSVWSCLRVSSQPACVFWLWEASAELPRSTCGTEHRSGRCLL